MIKHITLKEYLFYNNIRIIDMAQQLGYTRNHMSMIVLGKATAGTALARDIEEFTNGQVKASTLMRKKTSKKKATNKELES